MSGSLSFGKDDGRASIPGSMEPFSVGIGRIQLMVVPDPEQIRRSGQASL